MKRSVAITGPTPAFLRWAIARPCPLRPIDDHRFVDRTFRSLRNLRELSNAIDEDRVIEEFCLHPNTWQRTEFEGDEMESPANNASDEILGFGVDEIVAPFQGTAAVNEACHACPANVCRTSLGASWNTVGTKEGEVTEARANEGIETKQWVGCYGFLTRDGFSFDRLLSGHQIQSHPEIEFDLASMFVKAAEATLPADQFLISFSQGSKFKTQTKRNGVNGYPQQAWLLPWCTTPSAKDKEVRLDAEQIKILGDIFTVMVDQYCGDVGLPAEVHQFHAALKACREFNLPLVGQWLPAGFSDGQIWQLNASCEVCRFEPENLEASSMAVDTDVACSVCGSTTPLSQGMKFKVLGTRPYMHLSRIIGSEGIKMLRQRLS